MDKKNTAKKSKKVDKPVKTSEARKVTKEELKKIKGGWTPQQLWPWAKY